MQIHETALNNLIEQLDLNGRRMALPELIRYVAAKLHRTATAGDRSGPRRPDHRLRRQGCPVLRCTEDQLAVNLASPNSAPAHAPGRTSRSASPYRPEAHGRSAELVRDGVVQLIGRLSTGSQIALRGVFSEGFSQRRHLPLTPEWLLDDPRLEISPLPSSSSTTAGSAWPWVPIAAPRRPSRDTKRAQGARLAEQPKRG